MLPGLVGRRGGATLLLDRRKRLPGQHVACIARERSSDPAPRRRGCRPDRRPPPARATAGRCPAAGRAHRRGRRWPTDAGRPPSRAGRVAAAGGPPAAPRARAAPPTRQPAHGPWSRSCAWANCCTKASRCGSGPEPQPAPCMRSRKTRTAATRTQVSRSGAAVPACSGSRRTGSRSAGSRCFQPWRAFMRVVLLVDHIDPAMPADDAAILVADLRRLQAVSDLHDTTLVQQPGAGQE